MTWWESVLHALWLFLPAYVANMAPPLVAKVLPGWNTPMDGGRVGRDGHRVLGKGKTWRGLAGGAVLGGLTALAVSAIAPHWSFMDGWDYGASGSLPGESCTDCAPMAFAGLRVFLFGAGVGAFALIGDAVKSYFKRRRGKEGGAPWVPFDQLDFVVFGLAGMLLLSPLLLAGWVWAALTQDWVIPATLFLLTPVLHVAVNGLGYLLGLKKVPW